LNLWDIESGKLVRSFGRQSKWVLAAAFSPDGSLLASGGFDRSPRIWSTATGQEIAKLPEQPAFSDNLFFTPDGGQLVVPSRKGHVTVWDTDSWKLRQEFKVDGLFLLVAALSPDGHALAVGGEIQAADGKPPTRFGRVVVWDLQSAKVLCEFKLPDLVGGLCFSPDGKLLAATGTNEDVTIWNWEDNKVFARIAQARRTSGNDVMFLPRTGALALNVKESPLRFYKVDR
jgi:WD40 repeat protein